MSRCKQTRKSGIRSLGLFRYLGGESGKTQNFWCYNDSLKLKSSGFYFGLSDRSFKRRPGRFRIFGKKNDMSI